MEERQLRESLSNKQINNVSSMCVMILNISLRNTCVVTEDQLTETDIFVAMTKIQ